MTAKNASEFVYFMKAEGRELWEVIGAVTRPCRVDHWTLGKDQDVLQAEHRGDCTLGCDISTTSESAVTRVQRGDAVALTLSLAAH